MNRTFRGIGKSSFNKKENERRTKHLLHTAKALVRERVLQLRERRTSQAGSAKDAFDEWHRESCNLLIQLYEQELHGLGLAARMTYGQAQKWLNMTIKYCWVCGEEKLDWLERWYAVAHFPIDEVILVAAVKERVVQQRPCAKWSKWNDAAQYQAFQTQLRSTAKDKGKSPLQLEFEWWAKYRFSRPRGFNSRPAADVCPRRTIGILAFGSLITDPGEEIAAKIAFRIKTETPFPVEYARLSGKTRGGAPTLVRHNSGQPVAAEILVLDESVAVDEARDMLWNRERNKVGAGEKYVEGASKDSVLVRTETKDPRVANVHYTEFHDAGKIPVPTAADLAKRAIESVPKTETGKDGISYLINALGAGIKTPLTEDYCAEILRQTKARSLTEAIERAKSL